MFVVSLPPSSPRRHEGAVDAECMMNTINVVVTFPLDTNLMARIGETQENVRLVNLSQDLRPEKEHDVEASTRVREALASADVVFAISLPRDLVNRAPYVRWCSLTSPV